MKKHSARVAPLSACNSPVLTLTKVEGNGPGRRGLEREPGTLLPVAPGQRRAPAGLATRPPGCPEMPRAAHPAASFPGSSAPSRPVLSPLGLEHPAAAPHAPRLTRGVAQLPEARRERVGCRRLRHPPPPTPRLASARSEASPAHQPSDAPLRGRASR